MLKNINKIALIIGIAIILLIPHALMSPDSVGQFDQALRNSYEDWHPPLMAYSWRILYQITGIKTSIYYLYYILYSLGLIMISKYISKKSEVLSLVFIVITVIFTIFTKTGIYILKDFGMLASYLCSIGLILWIPSLKKMKRVVIYFIVLILLIYGTAIRANAIFSVIPLIFLLNIKIINKKIKTYRIIVVSLSMWGLLLFVINEINYNFLDAKKTYPQQYILISDLISLSYYKNLEIPEFMKTSKYTDPQFKLRYQHKANINNLIFGEESIIKQVNSKSEYQKLEKIWFNTVKKNLLKFLFLKIKYFLELLRYIFFPIIISNLYCFLRKLFMKKYNLDWDLIYLSSALYLYPYFIFNPSTDLRYIVYPIIIETFLFLQYLYMNIGKIHNFIDKIKSFDNIREE